MYKGTSSSNATVTATGGGVGFWGLLTLSFILLKITGFIDWPWWKVILLPIGVSLAMGLLVGVMVFVVFILSVLVELWKDSRQRRTVEIRKKKRFYG